METKLKQGDNNNYEKEIDHIINEYKNQLENIKTKTSLSQQIQPNSQTSIQPITNQELTIEIQNDNLKLQSELTLAKSQIKTLNSTINALKKEIEKLNSLIASKDAEFEKKIGEINEKTKNDIENLQNQKNCEISSKKEETEKISNKFLQISNLIVKYFDFFNKNIPLFSKAQVLSLGEAAKIIYDENDNEKNNSSVDFSLMTLNSFITKLMNDNTEMYNQLLKYKEMIDNNSTITSMTEQNIKDVKYENVLLKQQINSLIDKLSQVEKENENLICDSSERKNIMSKTSSKKKFFKKRSGSYINNNNISGYSNYSGNGSKTKVEIEPIKRLKLKIKNLEDKIKGSDMNNE